MKRFLMAAAAACCMAVAVSPAQATVIGTADAGASNSYPFGSSAGGAYYQQIYSASSFAGPMSINLISFYNSLSPSTNTPLNDTFTLFLSTTKTSVATFDTTNMTYPDASFTQVFSGKLSDLVNGRLDIALQTAFQYDPTAGNLLLTVKDFDFGSGGNLFLDADKNVGVTNMHINYNYDFNQGLVTGFNDAAVPEPATWAMMILGFGLVGGAMRRKAVTVAA